MGASQPGAPGAFCSRWLSPGHDSRGTGPTHPELNDPSIVSPVAQMVKNPPAMQETQVQYLYPEDSLEKGMATHFSILAQRIPWTEEQATVHGVAESDTTERLTLSLSC